MRLVKFHNILLVASLLFCQPSMSETAPIQKEQIALWDAVIAGDVPKAVASIKAGADVNGLDTRKNIAGPTVDGLSITRH